MRSLDPGSIDSELEAHSLQTTRIVAASLGLDPNDHAFDRRVALRDDVDDVDARAGRECVEQRFNGTGSFLGTRVNAMRAASRAGVERSVAPPRDLAASGDRRLRRCVGLSR